MKNLQLITFLWFDVLFYLNVALIKSCFGAMMIANCIYNQDQVINLTAGGYARLEVANYSLNFHCQAKFARTDGEKSIFFVFLNGAMEYFRLTGTLSNNVELDSSEYLWEKIPPWFSQIIPYPQLEFELADSSFVHSNGFQAFVYSPNSTELSSCPLASKTTPFTINNTLDIYPISSSFNTSHLSTPQKCSWYFELAQGLALKIHIKVFNLVFPSTLTISLDNNKTVILIAAAGVQYLNGSKFMIIYDSGSQSHGSFQFGGLISAVESNPILTENSCVENANNGSISFGNYDQEIGYRNNEVCQLTLPSNSSTTKTMSLVYGGFLEAGVDNLTITDNLGKIYDIASNTNWTISTANEISVNFKSDGNVVNSGFAVNVAESTCKCSNSTQTFSCKDSISFFPALVNCEYCSGMKCSYTINSDRTCGNFSSLLIPQIQLRPNSKDTVAVFENNLLIASFNVNTSITKHYLFKPESNISIVFESDPASFEVIPTPIISFGIANLNASKSSVNLTPDNFTHTVEVTAMPRIMLTINAPPNYTLDFYSYKIKHDLSTDEVLNSMLLYDSNSVENFVGILNNLPTKKADSMLQSYTSTSNSLTIFKSAKAGKNAAATIFFRLREIHSRNCLSHENVVNAYNSTFSNKALATGPCIVTVLNVNISDLTNTEYSNFRTDAMENVKLVAGMDANFTFLEFNSKTISTWSKLYFYGLSNSLIIPKGASLKFNAAFNLDLFRDGYSRNELKKGIYSSKTFVNPWKPEKSALTISITNDTFCLVTIKFLDLSPTASLNVSVIRFVESKEPSPIITRVNQTFNFTTVNYPDNIDVTFKFQEPMTGHRGYLIQYEMIPAKAVVIDLLNFWQLLCLIFFLRFYMFGY